MEIKKVVFKEKFSNPGFEKGQLVYWDESIVPQYMQPYPSVGRILTTYENGCWILPPYKSEADTSSWIWYGWERLCKIGVLYND